MDPFKYGPFKIISLIQPIIIKFLESVRAIQDFRTEEVTILYFENLTVLQENTHINR